MSRYITSRYQLKEQNINKTDCENRENLCYLSNAVKIVKNIVKNNNLLIT